MKAASLKEIKSELVTLYPEQVLELIIHLAKYKKDNKELLSYLLFDAKNENFFIQQVKDLVAEQFESMNKSNIYLAKKTLRKALRTSNKYIKYSGSKQIEVELLIFFCKQINISGIPLNTNTALGNIYLRQIQRIKKALATLHEDLQFDYSEVINEL